MFKLREDASRFVEGHFIYAVIADILIIAFLSGVAISVVNHPLTWVLVLTVFLLWVRSVYKVRKFLKKK